MTFYVAEHMNDMSSSPQFLACVLNSMIALTMRFLIKNQKLLTSSSASLSNSIQIIEAHVQPCD